MSRQLSNGIVVATSSTNVAVSASAVNADVLLGTSSGSGNAVHGVVSGTGATGRAGYFEQSVAGNGSDAVAVVQSGTGKGLNVSNTLSTNTADVITAAHSGTGKVITATQSNSAGGTAVTGTVNATTPSTTSYGLRGQILATGGSSGAGVYGSDNLIITGNSDGVFGQTGGTGPAIHGKVTGTGFAGFFEGKVGVSGGLLSAAGGATLANGKSASSMVMFGSCARFMNGLAIAAGWQYFGFEGTLTSYGVSCTIPHDAVALIGNFTTVPTAASGNGTFFTILPGNMSGAPGAVTANGGVNATVANGGNGLASYFPGIWPLGTIPSGTYINQKGVYIGSQSALTLYFDCFGYMTT